MSLEISPNEKKSLYLLQSIKSKKQQRVESEIRKLMEDKSDLLGQIDQQHQLIKKLVLNKNRILNNFYHNPAQTLINSHDIQQFEYGLEINTLRQQEETEKIEEIKTQLNELQVKIDDKNLELKQLIVQQEKYKLMVTGA